MFFSRKNNAPSGQAEVNPLPESDKTLSESNAVQSTINMQLRDMKELSRATADVIDKVKEMRIGEVTKQLQSIDSRLKGLEAHVEEQDKALAVLKSMPREARSQGDSEILEKAKAAASAAAAVQLALIGRRLDDLEEKISLVERRLASGGSAFDKHLPAISGIDASPAGKMKTASSTSPESPDDAGKRFEGIEAVLKSLESGKISPDKKILSAPAAIRAEVQAAQKQATSPSQYSPGVPGLKPLAPIQKSACIPLDSSRPKESHIIETTMDRAKKDQVKDAISSYEMRTIASKGSMIPAGNPKPGILSSIVSHMIPAAKKELPASQKERPDSLAMHDTAVGAMLPESAPKKEAPLHDLKETPVVKPAVISKPVDAIGFSARLSQDIIRAKQLVREKKYSEATEIYLMLINALEDSKSDPSVKGLAPAIDELYEYISSSLLTNLSAPEEKGAASEHKQNKPI